MYMSHTGDYPALQAKMNQATALLPGGSLIADGNKKVL